MAIINRKMRNLSANKKLKNSTSMSTGSTIKIPGINERKSLSLTALEPRILLDAAGVSAAVDGAADAIAQQQGDDAAAQFMENSDADAVSAEDDGNFEIHSGETINVDLFANDEGDGTLLGIIDPDSPDAVIALTVNEKVTLTSGLGVELLGDNTFNVTGPSNPTGPSVSFDYVIEDSNGEQSQATATFDWPVAPTIDLDVADTSTTNTTVFFDPAASNPVRLASADAVGIDLDGEEIVSLTLNFNGFTEANQEALLILNPDDSVNATFQFQPTAGAFPQGFFFEGAS